MIIIKNEKDVIDDKGEIYAHSNVSKKSTQNNQ